MGVCGLNGEVNREDPTLLGTTFAVAACCFLAATTRRTITGIASSATGLRTLETKGQDGGRRTRKSLLDVHHLPRTRLHESALSCPRKLQTLPTTHHSLILQIALVPRDKLHRLHRAGILPVLAFHVDHGKEVIKRIEGGGGRDVVHEEEGVGPEVGSSPETAVFFLAGSVGEGEVVRVAIDGAGDGIGVLYTVPKVNHGSIYFSLWRRRWFRVYLLWGHTYNHRISKIILQKSNH